MYTLLHHIKVIAPCRLYDQGDIFQFMRVPHHSISFEDIRCTICIDIINSPILLSCANSLICSGCLIKCINVSQSLVCPICYKFSPEYMCLCIV